MDNDNTVQVADSDNGSIYGPNAVTGGAEDALKGHEDVEIKTSDTKNVSVKETDDEGNKKEVKKEADKEDTKKSPKGDKRILKRKQLSSALQTRNRQKKMSLKT